MNNTDIDAIDANLDVLFAPQQPDLKAAYDQAHDDWFNADPASQSGKEALGQKQELISIMSDEGIAPGQVDAALNANPTNEETEVELDEIRRELGILHEAWQPTTPEEIDRIGFKFLSLDHEEDLVKAQYARRLKNIQAKRSYLEFRFLPALEAYRAKETDGKKQKYVDLPSCRLNSRKIPTHWKMGDERMVQAALGTLDAETKAKLKLETVSVVKSTDKFGAFYREQEARYQAIQKAKELREKTGEIVATQPLIAGFERVPEQEKFSIGGAK